MGQTDQLVDGSLESEPQNRFTFDLQRRPHTRLLSVLTDFGFCRTRSRLAAKSVASNFVDKLLARFLCPQNQSNKSRTRDSQIISSKPSRKETNKDRKLKRMQTSGTQNSTSMFRISITSSPQKFDLNSATCRRKMSIQVSVLHAEMSS